jgi:CBS domain-containing protein
LRSHFYAEYPPVTHLYFRQGDKLGRMEWSSVKELDYKNRLIKVPDMSRAEETSYEKLGSVVLLIEDILDGLIIDLRLRTTTRATDLRLSAEEGGLRLRSADASIGAMLRRVTRGYYRWINRNSLYDWKYVEFLRGDPEEVANGAGYHRRIARLAAGEIARLADYIPYLHAAELLMLLPDNKAADVLEAMSIERQLQVFEELDEKEAVNLLSLMSPDLAADLAGRLHPPTMKYYLKKMPKVEADRVVELLRYPEDVVGGVMINDMIFCAAYISVGEAKEHLRTHLKNLDFISLIYLVENKRSRTLKGVVTLREILSAQDDKQPLEEMMDPFLSTLDPNESAVEAAYRLVYDQLQAMPVTDADGQLIGVMTVDAALRQLLPASSTLQTYRVFS